MEVFSQKASVDFKPINVSAGKAKTDVLKDHDWWKNQNRMIQTNLREIDVKMNLDEYINTLKDFGANVVLVNVGGIVANYPTNLQFHYRNPFLENDFIGEVIKRLHTEGIRVIGRFDFSKINETMANNHPDWLSCDTLGKPFPPFNGQVPTCVNGAAMFGPPEKCYYTSVSDTPALYLHNFGKGKVAWFPWAVGTHFRQQGHAGHAALVEGVLTKLLELSINLEVDASPMIEANHRVARDNSFEWVSLINLSGQLDKFLQAPVPFGNIPVRIKPGCKVTSVTSLSNGNKLKFDLNNDGSITFTIPQLNEWEIVLLQ